MVPLLLRLTRSLLAELLARRDLVPEFSVKKASMSSREAYTVTVLHENTSVNRFFVIV